MMEAATTVTAQRDLVELLGLFYSIARQRMTADDAERMEALALKLLRSANKDVREAAQQSFTLYLDTLEKAKKEAVFRRFAAVLAGRRKLEPEEEEQAIRVVCAVVLDDTSSLRPLTKEALLFLLHYDSAKTAVNDIIANMISQFKKTHVKQLYRLKREFEEEDWEMLNANTKYVPY
ncbi:hypothetical protein WA577_006348, partial [Blastocystis sp. JDR]